LGGNGVTVCIGTEEYSLAQKYAFQLIKPGYMFQLYSHHQAYLQSLVELYVLNVYGMWELRGRDSSVGIVTGYGLYGPGIE
jgi:hypothetical protein